jgi:methionyl-tRNA formyltransferase
MRLAFMGTPDFAVPALAALLDAGHAVAVVYTQPPRPRGRGQALRPSPVHAFAEARGLEVCTPASMKAPEAVAGFQALDLDAAVVVAYGQILVREVLAAPRLGCFNLHASLLPRWRGAAPIPRAIMAGDATTGVQVMRMSEGLDEGPVLASAQTPIADDDTAATLATRLSALGAGLLAPTLDALARGTARETPQPDDGATYARKIKPAEARLDWARDATEIDRHVRGLSPFPGAWFEAPSPRGPVRVKALLSAVAQGAGAPGEVLSAGDGLVVAAGAGAVRLLKLQREGRAVQDAAAFLRGLPLAAGARLG